MPASSVPYHLCPYSSGAFQPAAGSALHVGQCGAMVYRQWPGNAEVRAGTSSQWQPSSATASGTCQRAGGIRRSCPAGLCRLVWKHDAQGSRRSPVAEPILSKHQVSDIHNVRSSASVLHEPFPIQLIVLSLSGSWWSCFTLCVCNLTFIVQQMVSYLWDYSLRYGHYVVVLLHKKVTRLNIATTAQSQFLITLAKL